VGLLGPAREIGAAERMVIADLGLPGEFPAEVEEAAEAVPAAVTPGQLEGRADFRDAVVITIDPADARDFDDAVAAEALPGGILRLWVHIADVAAYVPQGGALDGEAFARGTSVYFPGRVIPMLPHALSSGICSLKEGEDRLVQSVGIDYTRDAQVAGVRFADGVIRSSARLTYEEAAAILQGSGDGGRPEAAKLLALLAPLAKRLTARRMARGALDLDLPEVEVDRGKDGAPVGLRSHERNDAHRLIEEFMLAANEAVARRLAESKLPSVYRVHEEPDARDVEKVERELAELGVKRAAGAGLSERLARILRRFEGRPEEAIVGKHVLKAMKLARYAAERGEHFGLALTHYTHFTSPIRRYPDLAVHRLLRAARGTDGGKRPTRAEMEAVATESSRLERRAVDAERAITDLLVAHHLKKDLGRVFEGRVSGLSRGGIFVTLSGEGLPEGAAEGFAPAARGGGFVLTEPVRVRLEEADLLRGRLRLSILSE